MTEALRLPPAYRLVTRDAIDSTNDEAKRLARQGAGDGTLVWAAEQTAGRGRQGRSWTSPRGNLYASLILRPAKPVTEACQIGFVAAVALGAALGTLVPPQVTLTYKWPNDLLLNGRKTAGILIEAEGQGAGPVDWMVLGFGVNCASHPEGTAYPATSLKAETGAEIAPAAVLDAFARQFLAWVTRWHDGGFAPVRAEWLRHAHGLGEAITARLPRHSVSGIFVDLDQDGVLLLAGADGGRTRISAGDVYFSPPVT